jgi:hypothetical protein
MDKKITLASLIAAMTLSGCANLPNFDTTSRTAGYWVGETTACPAASKIRKLTYTLDLTPSKIPLLSFGTSTLMQEMANGHVTGASAEAQGEAGPFGGGMITEKRIIKVYGGGKRKPFNTPLKFISDSQIEIQIANHECPVSVVLTKQEKPKA